MIKELEAEIERLREENRVLKQCPVFGIRTRAALELEWLTVEWSASEIVFWDVDDLRELNNRYGYEGVNGRIREALGEVRTSELIGRYFSGDEFVIVVGIGEGVRAAARVRDAFKERGLSATFGVVRCVSGNLVESVGVAQGLVSAAKGRGEKGVICNFKEANDE